MSYFGDDFLRSWEVFCITYDLSTFDLKTVSKNRKFFNDFTLAWSATKILLEKEDLNVDITKIVKQIDTLALEINEQ